MTRSTGRRMKALKEKREAKLIKDNEELLQKMEQMGAAYSKETNLPATHVALVHEVETVKDEEKGTFRQITRYWYENHEERAKIADTHPDIQYLFSLAIDLNKAYTAKDGAAVKAGFEAMNEFLAKFEALYEQEQSGATAGQEGREGKEEETAGSETSSVGD